MRPTHKQKLRDLGSTVALSAVTDIVAATRKGQERNSGILAREVLAMIEQLDQSERAAAIAGVCDELEHFIEVVPSDPSGVLIAHLGRKVG
ncbi:hypothetical protein AYO46_07455 [Betaproteobacteria bacterium SCGC AG-212-J23]|nr:hypothetical protein AYO46_07455 [Betaproteobacteria bacterium SCGC AG-212-J23]